MYWDFHRTEQIGSAVTLSGANDTAITFGAVADVKRIVAVVTTEITVAAPSLTVQRVPLPSGTAGPVTLGVFTLPVGATPGSVFYFDIGTADPDPITPPDAVFPPGPNGAPLVSQVGKPAVIHTAAPPMGFIAPGNQLRVLCGGEATAGAALFYAEYLVQGFSGDRVAGAVERPAV